MKDNTIKLIKQKTQNKNNANSLLIKMSNKWFDFKQKQFAFVKIGFITKILGILLEMLIITLIVISISFFLIDAAPGKPSISSSLGGPAALAIENKYNLNDPAVQRWLRYIGNLFIGEFGVSLSIFPGVNINEFLWKRFFVSSGVGILAVALTLLLGIPLGVWAGRKITGFSAFVSTIFIAIMISIPSMVFGLMLLLIGRFIGIPYVYSGTNFLTWIIPALALALGSTIAYIKYIRTTMNQEIISQHAKFAKLKGATTRRFIWKHALKPSLFPVATFFPASILFVFVGGLFIERIFMIPGAGFLFTEAAQTKDTYVILLLTSIYTILTIISFRLRDWLYILLDPRVRRRGQ